MSSPIRTARVSQTIDRAGDFSVWLPLTDPRVSEIQKGRIWRQYREGEGFVFAGRIERVKKVPEDQLLISGPTLLGELQLTNAKFGRVFENITLNSVIDSLLALTPQTWARSGSVTTLVTVRLDGESVLRGIALATRQIATHFREDVREVGGLLRRRIEIGPLGSTSGVTLMSGNPNETFRDDSTIAWIQALTIEEDTQEIFNYLMPLGSGEGDLQVSLKYQTRLPNLLLNFSFESPLAVGATDWADNAAASTTFERQSGLLSIDQRCQPHGPDRLIVR